MSGCRQRWRDPIHKGSTRNRRGESLLLVTLRHGNARSRRAGLHAASVFTTLSACRARISASLQPISRSTSSVCSPSSGVGRPAEDACRRTERAARRCAWRRPWDAGAPRPCRWRRRGDRRGRSRCRPPAPRCTARPRLATPQAPRPRSVAQPPRPTSPRTALRWDDGPAPVPDGRLRHGETERGAQGPALSIGLGHDVDPPVPHAVEAMEG